MLISVDNEIQNFNSSVGTFYKLTSCSLLVRSFILQVKILEDLVLGYTESLKEHSLFNKDGELH